MENGTLLDPYVIYCMLTQERESWTTMNSEILKKRSRIAQSDEGDSMI